jgi:hypothetical protein
MNSTGREKDFTSELESLTGYRKPALQRRWLLENGYSFDVRADGRPSVIVQQVTARQLKGLAAGGRSSRLPDFTALDR